MATLLVEYSPIGQLIWLTDFRPKLFEQHKKDFTITSLCRKVFECLTEFLLGTVSVTEHIVQTLMLIALPACLREKPKPEEVQTKLNSSFLPCRDLDTVRGQET